QPAGGRGGRTGRAGLGGVLGEQDGAGPQVGPAAGGQGVHGGDGGVGLQFGGEPVEQHRGAAPVRVAQQRLDGLVGAAGDVPVHAPPAVDGELGEPGADAAQRAGGRRGGLVRFGVGVAGATQGGVGGGEQRVVH